MASPLLIVNADDFGRTAPATDSILACFSAGRLTSTTGMVYMADSERAASIAARHDLPIGLHLNLTQRYTDPVAPREIRLRQDRLVTFFRTHELMRWVYHPTLGSLLASCIQDQLDAFRRMYGREPSHIDSHHHAHVSSNVLLSSALPSGVKLRRTFTPLPGYRSWANRRYRSTINQVMARKFRGTTYFFDLSGFQYALRADHFLHHSGVSIEVMVHPEYQYDYALLMSTSWLEALEGFKLGSYDDL
jgi:predicted glycoside hydrolase/deacetylase ChbG (UPF0249 family)